MTEARVSVDLFNPGQVFACLGFLEVADRLVGDARGGFDWSDESDVCFVLQTDGKECPVALVFDFLINSDVREIAPVGWPGPPIANSERSKSFPSSLESHGDNLGEFKKTKLPIRLLDARTQKSVEIQHWADGSSRPDFKLYAGNRSGYSIACDMLMGKKSKPNKKHPLGKQVTFGIDHLWRTQPSELKERPFDVLVEMGGSFNLDARGAWTPLDAGYSPDEQGHRLCASPVVELLAALGLEDSRPVKRDDGIYQYSVWETPIPLQLARPLAAGCPVAIKARLFQFRIRLSGKNKIVSFSQEVAPL